MNEYTKRAARYLESYIHGVNRFRGLIMDELTVESYFEARDLADRLAYLENLVRNTIARIPPRSKYRARLRKSFKEAIFLYDAVCDEIGRLNEY